MKKLIAVTIVALLFSTQAKADVDYIDVLAAMAGQYNAERQEGIRQRKEESERLQEEYRRNWEMQQIERRRMQCAQNPYMCN